jgi:hypothetical protein
VSDADLVKAGVDAVLRPFTDLIMKIAGPAAEELGLTLQDHVKVLRLERQLRLFKRVKEILEKNGREPERVPLKLLQPIVENASVEEDDTLQDRWAALLANAAAGISSVHPAFIEVLKQLSSLDVFVLDVLWQLKNHGNRRPDARTLVNSIEVADGRRFGLHAAHLIDELEKVGVFGNLIRLGVMDFDYDEGGARHYVITQFGHIFIYACNEH